MKFSSLLSRKGCCLLPEFLNHHYRVCSLDMDTINYIVNCRIKTNSIYEEIESQ